MPCGSWSPPPSPTPDPATLVAPGCSLLPAVIVGAGMSRLVHHRLEDKLMRYLILGFALASGIVVTVHAL
jgi:uncharacterized membrane protein YfcA